MSKRDVIKSILVLHGPNLNMLGRRNKAIYGSKTLEEINTLIEEYARDIGMQVSIHQSNSEGELVDLLQAHAPHTNAIIINPGALTHYGLSLRDALEDTGLTIVEVHISNIYARESWRSHSVIAAIAKGQISGMGWRGYTLALKALAESE